MVFWWTGKGFLTLLFVIGVFGAFGAIVTFTAGDQTLAKFPWLNGVALLIAGIVNWLGGRRLNRRPLSPLRWDPNNRILYRARHRFLSVSMELWSVPIMLVGLVIIAKGLL